MKRSKAAKSRTDKVIAELKAISLEHAKTVSDYLRAIGAKGGKAKGPRKARSPEHYEKMAKMRRKKP